MLGLSTGCASQSAPVIQPLAAALGDAWGALALPAIVTADRPCNETGIEWEQVIALST